MALFGKKKTQEIKYPVEEEIKLPTIEELKVAQKPTPIEKLKQELPEEILTPKETVVEKKEWRKEYFPLFVKLEKYEEILDMLTELKNSLNALKDSLLILDENEKIMVEATKTIKSCVENVENKISALNSILVRPGYEEKTKEESKTEEIEDILSTLRTQIDQLKQEIETK